MQVREYMMQQINSTDDDGLLMNIVIEGMICDTGGIFNSRFASRKLSHAYLFSAFETLTCHFVLSRVAIIDSHQSALLVIFVMITYTQSELQTWARPCS